MSQQNFNRPYFLFALSHYPALSVAKKWQLLTFAEQKDLDLQSVIPAWNQKMPTYSIDSDFFTRLSVSELEDELKEWGINWIDFDHPAYPPQLKHIYEAPLGLYVKGDLSLLSRPSLAIVGSRRCSAYAEQVIKDMMVDIIAEDWVIVSGLARGVDTLSHRAALQEGGQTIGVIGTGLDRVYPAENRQLQLDMSHQQAVVSEYPLGRPPLPAHFPMRNRIIAGLSQGCLVVEAQFRSGSLITANIALNEGREVFAVPGSIYSELSEGCNDLIKHGAK